MSGTKYREIGRRGPIHVHCVSQTAQAFLDRVAKVRGWKKV